MRSRAEWPIRPHSLDPRAWPPRSASSLWPASATNGIGSPAPSPGQTVSMASVGALLAAVGALSPWWLAFLRLLVRGALMSLLAWRLFARWQPMRERLRNMGQWTLPHWLRHLTFLAGGIVLTAVLMANTPHQRGVVIGPFGVHYYIYPSFTFWLAMLGGLVLIAVGVGHFLHGVVLFLARRRQNSAERAAERQTAAKEVQLLTPAELEAIAAENPDYDVQLESLSQWQLAWRRFWKHRMAIVGASLFLFMVLVGVVGPYLIPFNSGKFVPIDQIDSIGRPPMFYPYLHPFGETAHLQYDVLTMTVIGIRHSLMIGISATIIATALGAFIGGISGYYGGWLDTILMRFVDAMLSLPLLFLILVFTKFLGAGSPVAITLIFGLFGWMTIARLVRSVILSLREEDYVDAARAAGLSDARIIFRHLMPNSLSPIIVSATLSVAGVIISEAFVSFLGFGVSLDTPTLGNILSNAEQAISNGNWWWAFFPGLAIMLIVLGINFMGDGLQDALDPRAKV